MLANSNPKPLPTPLSHRLLQPHDIQAIEEALKRVGAFGEVHLVIERGRIRFLRTVTSETLEGVRPPINAEGHPGGT